MKPLTLVMLLKEKERQVLLGLKQRGFGCGRWNSFGGKIQGDETIEECAKRETEEECGLRVNSFYEIGNMIFEFVGDPVLLDVHVFSCNDFSGEVTPSEEMLPKWFAYEDVPFDKMWPDDILWYPLLFKQQKFKAYYLFEGHDKILKHDSNLHHPRRN